MPRHSRDLRLFTSLLQSCVEINETLAGFLVVEDVFILPSQGPEIENTAYRFVDRHDAHFLSFFGKHVDQSFLKVHVLPAERENLPDAATRIQGI